MAYSENLETISLPAGADLSAKQYYFVSTNTDGEAVLAGDGAPILGVLQNKPLENEPAQIGIGGVSKVVAGEAYAGDANLASDANGKAVGAATGDYIRGRAIGAPGAADVIGSIALVSQGRSA